VLYFEELILLRSMEGRDQELTKRLAKCRQEKGLILRDINGISSQLRDKKVEIDKIKAREDDLMAKFHELCAEGSDKYDIIRAYFEKVQKIRKGKRTQQANPEKEAGGAGEDEEEPEEEEEPEDEDEDEDEENAIVGLPQEEYKIDEIDKLREERTKMYNEKQDILAFINNLEVSRKKLEKQEERISLELEETEEEIQDF
jgi:chromosome segregation ATPase